jgi:serine protease inhibitor
MKTEKSILIFILIILLPVTGCKSKNKISDSHNPMKDSAAISAIAEANNEFALSLYKKTGDEEKNIVFSPYSISSALAVTYAGARGNTAKEMAEVLWFPKDQSSFHPGYKAFTDSILLSGKEKGTELRIANALWVQQDYKLRQDFIELAASCYNAKAENVNFKMPEELEKTRQKINKWVEDATNNRIRNLLQQGVLKELTRLVITNAIWFNGNWVKPFDTSATYSSIFNINSAKSINTEFMHQKTDAGYYEDDEIQALEFPYKGGKKSMLIILPKETEGWRLIGRILTTDRLKIISQGLKIQEVDIAIPKFKYESQFSLKETLIQMGMEEPFSNSADFSGMTDANDLKIDEVIHKAFIEVNETGTEAAAATAVIMILKSALNERTVRFNANHPFIYFITDKTTGGIIFMGRLVNPE